MQIPQLKSLLPLADLLAHLGLKPNNRKALRCPFHQSNSKKIQHTMQYYPETNTVYCFSTNCPTHGHSLDQISFVKNFFKLTTDHEAIMKCKQIIHELGRWPTNLYNPFIHPLSEKISDHPPMKTTEEKAEQKKEELENTEIGPKQTQSNGAEKIYQVPYPSNHTNHTLQEQSEGYHLWTNLLHIRTIGNGIQHQPLHMLKVTLGITKREHKYAHEAIRHSLDLYHEDSVQKLIKKSAEKLSYGLQPVTQDIMLFIELLEAEKLKRYEEAEQQNQPLTQEYKMSEAEQKESLEKLQQENLLQWLYDIIPQTGIIGEQTNAAIIIISMGTCRLSHPVSVTCLSPSGTGKSYTMDKCSECLPQEWVKRGTSFSEQSFYHFGRTEVKHKIFIIEDSTGAKSIDYTIRQLISEHLIIKYMAEKNEKTGKIATVEYPVEGPVCLCMTTTADKQYIDNSNRVIEIYLDGSKEQDQRIADYQKQVKAGLINKEQQKQLQYEIKNMFRMLHPYPIINPYATVIDIPEKYLYKRRGLQLLFHFIDGITHLCQYQNNTEKAPDANGEVTLITHPIHIEWGFKLLRETLFRKSDELTKRVRELFEQIKMLLEKWNKHLFSQQEIRKELRMEPRTLNKYLSLLKQYGFIKRTGGNKNKGGYLYEINEAESEKQLHDEIDRHIETILKEVWAMHQERKKNPKNKFQSE